MADQQKKIPTEILHNLISINEIKNVAHDLNNLLNNIINGIDLIKESVDNNPKTEKILTNIKENSNLASNLLLQLTSPVTKKNNYKSTVHLNDLVNNVIDGIGNDRSNILNVKFVSNAKDDKILGNQTELKRALINLLVNAQEAANNQTEISITLNPALVDGLEFLTISIIDNGKGIPQNDILKIFDEGFSSKEKGDSRGLGLAIVKKIVKDHSGTVNVKSILNKGTTFQLSFPKNFLKRNIKKLKNKTVLLAEDDSFQREVLKDLLNSLNINVLSSINGIEALDMIKNTNIDLLIIDKIMPLMDGEECISEIRKLNYSFPIVLTSGSDIDEATELNVSRILNKPYNFEMIQTTLLELLT